jgi:hypothetical protein
MTWSRSESSHEARNWEAFAPRLGLVNQLREPDSISANGGLTGKALHRVHFDRSPGHRTPAIGALVVATALSLAGSLLADWLLTKLAVAVFPSTKGYPHFQFGDYSTLTILGVIAACAGWPIVARWCSQPRWLFVRLAVLVSLALLLPDLAILVQGQPAKAVLFLALMHIAIAVVTYNALVRLSPVRAIPEQPLLTLEGASANSEPSAPGRLARGPD